MNPTQSHLRSLGNPSNTHKNIKELNNGLLSPNHVYERPMAYNENLFINTGLHCALICKLYQDREFIGVEIAYSTVQSIKILGPANEINNPKIIPRFKVELCLNFLGHWLHLPVEFDGEKIYIINEGSVCFNISAVDFSRTLLEIQIPQPTLEAVKNLFRKYLETTTS